jgi:hypothetical protein
MTDHLEAMLVFSRAGSPLLFSSLEEALSLSARHRRSSQENHIGSRDTPVLVSRLRLQGLSPGEGKVAPWAAFYCRISSIAVYLLLPEQPILDT